MAVSLTFCALSIMQVLVGTAFTGTMCAGVCLKKKGSERTERRWEEGRDGARDGERGREGATEGARGPRGARGARLEVKQGKTCWWLSLPLVWHGLPSRRDGAIVKVDSSRV